MSNFPQNFDDDTTLPVVNDNLTEIGGEAINALRDAVFNIEMNIGLGAAGTTPSIAARLGLLINPDGTPNASTITSLGLVTLPITQNQIADNAGIPESKLHLDYRTQDLFNYIRDLSRDVNLALGWISVSGVKLEPHLIGAIYRHDLAQIDVAETSTQFLNNVFRVQRDNANSYTLINDMNNELLAHQWADGSPFGVLRDITTNNGSIYPSYFAHVASGIFVNTSRFQTIPQSNQDVQSVLEYIDSSSILLLGTRIQNLYSNGISVNSRSSTLQVDGYGQPIVPVTPATAFLLFPNGTASSPIDDISHGDDIIQFNPTDGYTFDAQFALVNPGDIVRINYGTVEVAFVIEGKKYIPGSGGSASQYFVRIAGRNLFSSAAASARIDRPLFNNNKYGVLALAPVNNPATGTAASLVVGNPRGAQVLGVGLNLDQLDSAHYLLYLALYPNGNPLDGYTILPAIDVTGNQGVTPGSYTLDSIVASTNVAFRRAGYNYRFIAFQNQGEFGVMLADSYNGAAFSIINAAVIQSGPSAGQIDVTNTNINFPNNVVSVLPTNLPGTFNISNGSAAVTATVSMTSFLVPGSQITFGAQPGVVYIVLTVSGTSITLTTTYGGVSNTASTAAVANGVIPDPLGIGFTGANVASPPFMSSYSNPFAAQLPTKLFVPLRRNNYYVNGVEKDDLNLQEGQTLDAFGDGYWVATIDGYTNFPGIRTSVQYNIPLFLSTSDLKVGKTIVVQPLGGNGSLNNFGRFIITNIQYEDGPPVSTTITVYDAVHATGVSPAPILPVGSQVAIYFNSDSVAFDAENVSDFNNYVPSTTNFKRHFEVYVDQNANTYTHERARLSLSASNITINNITLFCSSSLAFINIVSVSPKLKGFSSSGLTKINLQVESYDQTTGVFTAFLCNFNGSVTNPGPVTFGQKGQVTRLYDYTNIDYIDVIFNAADNVPQIPLPGGNIDIQLFPTLSLDEEIMLLGTCQFNDATGQVTYLQDQRQFGNISEEQLSSSAIEFIEAPTRELHENGIIRGFDILLQAGNTVSFSGGTALINGKIVQINPQTVVVPAVFEAIPIAIGGPPTITNTNNTITWFVCANESGEIELIASTDFDPLIPSAASYQPAHLNHLRLFYAMNPNASLPVPYQVRGTFFSNLVLTQKDVVPFATIGATVTNPGGGFAVTSLLAVDARRFVTNGYGGLAEPLVLGALGSFRSLISLNNWLIQFNELVSGTSAQGNPISNTVIVKGHIDIDAPAVLGFAFNEVIFRGDAGVFDVFVPTGFELTGNIHFDNLTFNYYYDPTVVIDPLAYTALTGTFTLAGSTTVATSSSQVGILTPGSVVIFSLQPGVTFTVVSVSAGSIVLNTTTNSSGANTGFYGGYNTKNYINTGRGLIYVPVTEVDSNVSVTNCVFNWIPTVANTFPLFTAATSTSINRHSFINVELAQPTALAATMLQGVEISGNRFNDQVLTTFAPAATNTVRAVISFVSTSTATTSGFNMKLTDVVIRDNFCDKDQMIAIAPTYSTTPNAIYNTINAVNVLIENNTCGSIAVFTEYYAPFETLGALTFNFFNFVLDKNNGTIIRGNTCKYIHSVDSTGQDISNPAATSLGTNLSTGPMIVSDNTVSWIKLPLNTTFVGDLPCVIKNNVMIGYDTNFLKLFTNTPATVLNAAIQIDYIGAAPTPSPVCTAVIDGNSIGGGVYATTSPPLTQFFYDIGVYVLNHDANIVNNFIANLAQTVSVIAPVGVWLQTLGGGVSVHSDISKNKFYRFLTAWTTYIFLGTGGAHTVADNFFDQFNPSGVYPANFDQQVTGSAINTSSIRGNVNQVISEVLSLVDEKLAVTSLNGNVTQAQTTIGPANDAAQLYTDGYNFQVYRFTQNNLLGADAGSSSMYVATLETIASSVGSRLMSFTIPLSNRLPQGVKILSLQLGVWAILDSGATFNISSDYNAFSLTLNRYSGNATSGLAASGVVDVKNNIQSAFVAFGTDLSVLQTFSDTFLLGSTPSSGNNSTGTYRVITPTSLTTGTQTLNIISGVNLNVNLVTGGNYRLAAQFDAQYLANNTPLSSAVQLYFSPLLVTYTW